MLLVVSSKAPPVALDAGAVTVLHHLQVERLHAIPHDLRGFDVRLTDVEVQHFHPPLLRGFGIGYQLSDR